MSVPLDEWQEIWHREYLADYIPSGGSTVKILVAGDQDLDHVVESTVKTAESAGFLTVKVDSAVTRCHMIQEIFYAVSRTISWESATNLWLQKHLEEEGYLVPEGVPLRDIESIAEANCVDAKSILHAANKIIYREVVNDKSLWYQFGIAMAAYCAGRIRRVGISDQDSELAVSWLRGEKVTLTRLRRLRITERIGRHNARPILISLARWCRKIGIPGICIVINLAAVYSPSEATINYARPALLDLYELLRQFIDETEDMSNLSIVAVASRGIVDDPKLSYDNYDAFKMRIVNDVRDRIKDNPLNTLVTVDLNNDVRFTQ